MTDTDIVTTQLKLLDKVKKYLGARSLKDGQKVASDPSCYLNSWATGSLGYLRLQCLHKGFSEFPNYSYRFLRSVLQSGASSSYKIVNLEQRGIAYKHIVISWCRQDNFLEDGSFQCSYFSANSKNTPNTLWFLLSLDNVHPRKLNKNIRIFVSHHENHYSVLRIFKNIWKWVVYKIIPVPETLFAHALTSVFTSEILKPEIKSVLMAYEAQPWQHKLNQGIKSFNSTIKTIGYLHSSLPPLPTDFVKRDGEPDFLFVHGKGQKKIFQKYLGWEKKNIQVINSLRFQKATKKKFSGKIFIPYDFSKGDFYIELLESFFKKMDSDMPPLKIRNHPAQSQSKKHAALIKNIENLLARYQDRFDRNSKRQIALIFGSTTTVLECLARDIEVIHMTTEPVYESYSASLWPELKINKIENHIFSYKQKNKDEYIALGERNTSLRDILFHA